MSNIVEVAKYDESSAKMVSEPRPLGRALRQAVRVAMPKRLPDGSLVPGTPVGLIGRPGIGKTAALRGVAEGLGYGVVTVVGATLTPEMVSGLPSAGSTEVVDSVTGEKCVVPSVVYLKEPYQVRIMQERRCVLFLDEYSNSGEDVQAAMLMLLNERRFPDGTPLPVETAVILAMNSAGDSVNPSPIELPVQGRVSWIPVQAELDEWIEGARVNWGKPMLEYEPRIREMITGFLSSNVGSFMEADIEGRERRIRRDVPENCREALMYAWRSPRSWNNFMFELAAVPHDDAAEFIEEAEDLALSLVGYDAMMHLKPLLAEYAAEVITKKAARVKLDDLFVDPALAKKHVKSNDADTAALIATDLERRIASVADAYGEDPSKKNLKKVADVVVATGDLVAAVADRESYEMFHPALRTALYPVLVGAIGCLSGVQSDALYGALVPVSGFSAGLAERIAAVAGGESQVALLGVLPLVEGLVYADQHAEDDQVVLGS